MVFFLLLFYVYTYNILLFFFSVLFPTFALILFEIFFYMILLTLVYVCAFKSRRIDIYTTYSFNLSQFNCIHFVFLYSFILSKNLSCVKINIRRKHTRRTHVNTVNFHTATQTHTRTHTKYKRTSSSSICVQLNGRALLVRSI